MKVLLDVGRTLRNDQLLAQASQVGFTALVTADKKLGAQQGRPHLAVVAVDDNRLSSLRPALDDIARAVRSTPPGEHRLVTTHR